MARKLGGSSRLEFLCWIGAAALGALQAAAGAAREAMGPDGISYLDIAHAYLRGDWQAALNGYWSPLYPGLLAIALGIVRPTPRWEFPLAHLVNLAIYWFALLCFASFWREALRRREPGARAGRREPSERQGKASVSEQGGVALPAWASVAVGYALFAWSSLCLTGVWSVTPDILVAAFVYLAGGLTMRIHRGAGGARRFILLGIVLGLAFWTKAAMFPLAFVWLAVGVGVTREWRRPALALASFGLLAAPLVTALSHEAGRPTFGESARLSYAWYVNGVTQPHWQGEVPGHGTPVHPTRKLLDSPSVYAFGEPVGGTYPPWYDPSYWYEGVRTRFDLGQQLLALGVTAREYHEWFFRQLGGLLAGAFVLHWMSDRRGRGLKGFAIRWELLLPALSAFAMYALVHVEGRFVAPFVVLFWAAVLVDVRLCDSPGSRRVAAAVAAVMVLMLLVDLSTCAAKRVNAFAHLPSPWRVAAGLHRLGVREGERVAFLGYAQDAYWAQPARVRIVAETFEEPGPAFWSDRDAQRRTLQAMGAAGATVAVARGVPPGALRAGWRRVGDTDHFVLWPTLGTTVSVDRGAAGRANALTPAPVPSAKGTQ